jgi:hypothetical protein
MGYDVYGSMMINCGMHRGQHGFPESIVDHLSERCLDHVWSTSRPVGWHD